MSFFILLNISNSYLVEELDIYNINDKIIKNAFKDIFSFINPLGPLPKE